MVDQNARQYARHAHIFFLRYLRHPQTAKTGGPPDQNAFDHADAGQTLLRAVVQAEQARPASLEIISAADRRNASGSSAP